MTAVKSLGCCAIYKGIPICLWINSKLIKFNFCIRTSPQITSRPPVVCMPDFEESCEVQSSGIRHSPEGESLWLHLLAALDFGRMPSLFCSSASWLQSWDLGAHTTEGLRMTQMNTASRFLFPPCLLVSVSGEQAKLR